MKAIVTGASGMLGGAVLRALIARGEVAEGWSCSTARTEDKIDLVAFDLDAFSSGEYVFERAFHGDRPDLIVHSAALTDADRCEVAPERAYRVNAVVPGHLAGVAARMGVRLVYVSTDAVYSDAPGGRREEGSPTRPRSVYASSKLEGEGRVLSVYPEALVVRTTMFGWTAAGKRPKLAEAILADLTGRRPCRLWSDAYFSPLHVSQLAEVILDLAERDVSGVLNVGARDPISKADFGREVAATFGLDASLIEETSVEDANLAAARPRNVGLDVRELTKIWGSLPTVTSGINRLYREAFDGSAERIRGRSTYP